MNTSEYCAALAAAAKAKGRALTSDEMAQVAKGPSYTREQLQQRFINVIRSAGYVNDAPERICAEWLDKYMQDIPNFIRMMEEYERTDGDPMDDDLAGVTAPR